ncbi:hypothetical protein X801_08110, partial [Opisthorchis viverrini]
MLTMRSFLHYRLLCVLEMKPAASPLHQTIQSSCIKSTTTGSTDSNAVRDGVRELVNQLLSSRRTPNGYPAVVVDQPCLLERKLNALLDRGIGAFQWEDTLEFYLPIERDLNMPDVEKAPHMVEFWNKAHDLLVQANLHQSLMKSVMQDSKIVL